MKCKCGGETEVLSTRNKTVRRRQCLSCGLRFTTREILIEDPLEPFRQWVRDRIKQDPENAYDFIP